MSILIVPSLSYSFFIESARVALHDEGFIALLVPLISSENKDLCLQCIRALGNLCYEQGTINRY